MPNDSQNAASETNTVPGGQQTDAANANANPADDKGASTQQTDANKTNTDGANANADANKDGKTGTESQKKDDGKKNDTVIPFKAADITLPEGMTRDEDALGKLTAFAEKHKLSKEAAQELANLGAESVSKTSPAKVVEEARKQWRTDVEKDAELGGAKMEENLSIAKKGLDAFGTPALRELLNQSGLGDHPEVIRAFHKAGALVSEGKIITGGSASRPLTQEEKMYPNQGKKSA